jgi:hypothetical protein
MVFNNNLLIGAASAGGGYDIDQSIRFNFADAPSLKRTPGTASNQKTWTWSAWVKRSGLGDPGGPNAVHQLFGVGAGSCLRFTSTDALRLESLSGNHTFVTTQLFRDASAWYHIVLAFDSTQATDTNRRKLYVNGSQVTSFSSTTFTGLAQNVDWGINSTSEHQIGKSNLADYFGGYMADIVLIDGTALEPDSFGKTNADGVWVPIDVSSLTFGTNGYYITGATAADLGEDFSGNGNDYTSAGLATTDQMLDTPTNNFCTWNPLDKNASITLSDGNLKLAVGNVNSSVRSTFAASSGKWYWEITITSSSGYGTVGVTNSLHSLSSSPGNSTVGVGYRCSDGGKVINGTYTASYGASYTTGDVIGVALNMEDGEVTFYKNNVSQGVAATGLSGTLFAAAGNENNNSLTWTANFGQSALTYTPPTGFLELNTANLPEPTIKDGSANFQTTLYTGNGTAIGSGGNAISQSGNSTFQPDFAWIKKRSAATEYVLTDAVRGVTKELSSNDAGAEETVAEGLTTFGSAGFTVGSDGSYNTSSATYAAWQWKANGAGSSNTDGTINTTATSANTTAGFSLVTYVGNGTSGATVGHGLGVVPNMIIVKNRDQADAWQVYHSGNTAAPETEYLVLNTTAATVDNVNRWNDTAPTSSVFSLGNAVEVNTSGENYVAYCFANIEGYSKFGSYAGNSLTDGAFVHLGFRPALLWIRNPTAANYWYLYDTARNPTNVSANIFYGFTTDAENIGNAAYNLDIVSNGFKLRNSNAYLNSANMIYMAFAENPFGGENTSPATAR